uniref:Secreted protein n=1 Tax=Amphiprion ocellaris TaxID=80972 RepID=A0AAQ6AM04_AMPOC
MLFDSRVLWISCLLIGSISCLPVKDTGPSTDPVWSPYRPSWYPGTGGSDQASDQSAGAAGYVGGDWFHTGQVGGSQGSQVSTGDPTDDGDEPFFSDTSDLDKVYAFSSRSRYQRGRAMFAQTRYTPTEPLFPPVPIFKYHGDSKTPIKGSF